MTIEEMKQKKREYGYTNQMVSELTGIPLGTVQKVFSGATQAPRKDTIDALERLLGGAGNSREYGKTDERPDLRVHETGQNHTRNDGNEGFGEEQTELIEGSLYRMEAPTRKHQGILLAIAIQLDHFVSAHPGKCFLYTAPAAVELDRDTMVRPDLYLHCDPDREADCPYQGAPDFVLEILSAADRGHDLWKKQALYRKYGVREYWIVDPEQKRLTVYSFEKEELPYSYTFEDEVPLGISGGSCKVDLKKVCARVRHLYSDR